MRHFPLADAFILVSELFRQLQVNVQVIKDRFDILHTQVGQQDLLLVAVHHRIPGEHTFLKVLVVTFSEELVVDQLEPKGQIVASEIGWASEMHCHAFALFVNFFDILEFVVLKPLPPLGSALHQKWSPFFHQAPQTFLLNVSLLGRGANRLNTFVEKTLTNLQGECLRHDGFFVVFKEMLIYE